jgi:hypothetical protein
MEREPFGRTKDDVSSREALMAVYDVRRKDGGAFNNLVMQEISMRTFRTLLAILAFASFAGTARASAGTNYTDQWWNPNESGWGAAILQQHDVLFIDLFVYGPDARPTWYTAALFFRSDLSGTVFSGDLAATTGPWFGAFFNPNLVATRKVGTIVFSATSTDTAVLTYTVDGIAVSKNIERQTWAFEDFSGNYFGGFVYDQTGCANPANNGHVEEFGTIDIAHGTDNSFSLQLGSNFGTCTFAGHYDQAGHVGNVSTNYTCTYGINGTVLLYEMERTGPGMTGRFFGQNNACNVAGTFGGIQR